MTEDRRRSGASALSMSENVDNRVEDRRQAAAFYWQEMELYAQRLLACLRTAHADGVRDEMVQLMLARKNWELQTTLVEDRRLFGASLAHRRMIWNRARRVGLWPTRDEWRFIILGRWKGF